VEFIKAHYRGFIIRAANWLMDFRDPESGLPRPSWDLWEERRGIMAWTVGAVWSGLQAAADFAAAFGESELSASYRQAAAAMKAGVECRLWSPERNRYSRMIVPRSDGLYQRDDALDSSIVGLWYFGMFPAGDARIVSTMEAFFEHLRVPTAIGGMARYQDDRYHRVSLERGDIPGNPWFICALWMAQWRIAIAKSSAELNRALEFLEWTAAHALPSGILAEQIHPLTGEPLSVSPLTWSHAAFVLAVQQFLEKKEELHGGRGQY